MSPAELPESRRFFVCLKVAGVGDLNNIDFGTVVHQGMLREAGILTDNNQLRFSYPLPSTRELIGVDIEDLLVLLQLCRHAARLPALDTALAQSAEAAYVKVYRLIFTHLFFTLLL